MAACNVKILCVVCRFFCLFLCVLLCLDGKLDDVFFCKHDFRFSLLAPDLFVKVFSSFFELRVLCVENISLCKVVKSCKYATFHMFFSVKRMVDFCFILQNKVFIALFCTYKTLFLSFCVYSAFSANEPSLVSLTTYPSSFILALIASALAQSLFAFATFLCSTRSSTSCGIAPSFAFCFCS